MTKKQAKKLKKGSEVWYYSHIFSRGVYKVKIHDLLPYNYCSAIKIIEYHDGCRDEAGIEELFLTKLDALLEECKTFKCRISELQDQMQEFQSNLEHSEQEITDILLSEGKSGAEIVHVLVNNV